MQLGERIHLVGSGSFGFDLTDPDDCHVYLVDGGSELALVNVGADIGAARIVANVERRGVRPGIPPTTASSPAPSTRDSAKAAFRSCSSTAGAEACSPATSSSAAARSCSRASTTAASSSSCVRCASCAGSQSTRCFPAMPFRERGQRHIERANEALDTLLVPPQAVPAW